MAIASFSKQQAVNSLKAPDTEVVVILKNDGTISIWHDIQDEAQADWAAIQLDRAKQMIRETM